MAWGMLPRKPPLLVMRPEEGSGGTLPALSKQHRAGVLGQTAKGSSSRIVRPNAVPAASTDSGADAGAVGVVAPASGRASPAPPSRSGTPSAGMRGTSRGGGTPGPSAGAAAGGSNANPGSLPSLTRTKSFVSVASGRSAAQTPKGASSVVSGFSSMGSASASVMAGWAGSPSASGIMMGASAPKKKKKNGAPYKLEVGPALTGGFGAIRIPRIGRYT